MKIAPTILLKTKGKFSTGRYNPTIFMKINVLS